MQTTYLDIGCRHHSTHLTSWGWRAMPMPVLAGRRRGMMSIDPCTPRGSGMRQTITIAITMTTVLSAAARRSAMAPLVTPFLAGSAVVLTRSQHAFAAEIYIYRGRWWDTVVCVRLIGRLEIGNLQLVDEWKLEEAINAMVNNDNGKVECVKVGGENF